MDGSAEALVKILSAQRYFCLSSRAHSINRAKLESLNLHLVAVQHPPGLTAEAPVKTKTYTLFTAVARRVLLTSSIAAGFMKLTARICSVPLISSPLVFAE